MPVFLEQSNTRRQRFRLLKRLIELLVWCLVLGLETVPFATAATLPVPIQFGGRDWYELAAWSNANGLAFTWNRTARLLHLTNQTARVTLALDSPQSVINGVKVWLSLPITPRGGKLHISRLDVETVLKPLLAPTRPNPPHRIRTIMLDPGHGGKDPGNQEGRELEKRYTLLLAQQVRSKLEAAGYHVLLTRSRDTFIDLPERAALANRAKADLFLSLHFNAVPLNATAAQGIETFCLTPSTAASTHERPATASSQSTPGHQSTSQSVLLAYHVQKMLVQRLGMVDRGVKRARFAVLRDATMPSVLIEGGFMSKKEELAKLMDASFRARMADAIVEAIRGYRRQVGG